MDCTFFCSLGNDLYLPEKSISSNVPHKRVQDTGQPNGRRTSLLTPDLESRLTPTCCGSTIFTCCGSIISLQMH
jgi:hypothetical protein